MNDDELRNRRKKLDYLSSWIDRLGQAQQILPLVQKQKQTTEWEIEALSHMPDEANFVPPGDISKKLEIDFTSLTKNLPMIPTYYQTAFSSTDAISTAGTMCIYDFVSRIGDINTPITREYSEVFTTKYQEIQIAQNRPNDIRRLLDLLPNKNTLERFGRAETSYMNFKAGVGEKTSAAMEMRTFLDGCKGNLQQIAKKSEKENTPTWEKMAERLSKNGSSSEEYQEFLQQKKIYESLKCKLSNVGKDMVAGSTSNLNHIWTELLDHVFTILNLIDFEGLKY